MYDMIKLTLKIKKEVLNMHKKIIAVLLSMLMMLSMASVAFAAEVQQANEEAKIEENIDTAVAEALGVDESDIKVDDAFVEAIAEEADGDTSLATVSEILSAYIFIDPNQVSGIADRIADSAKYYVADDNQVYIVVNLEKNPEIVNILVLCATANRLLNRHLEFAKAIGGDLITMDYEHIVGELFLHGAVFFATKLVGGDSSSSSLYSYYAKAVDAELNAKEDRGASAIKAFGSLLSMVAELFGYKD